MGTRGGIDITKPDGTIETWYATVVNAVVPEGNQDIETLNEYDVSSKATARISETEREKIIPENIKKDVEILGVVGELE